MKMDQIELRELTELPQEGGSLRVVLEAQLGAAVASQIQSENTLLDQRLTWTLQLNGFLFTALGLLGAKGLADKALQSLVNLWIPVTGCVVSLACLLGVIAAQMQLDYLAAFWDSMPRGACPRPFGDKRRGSYVLGMLPCLMPPGILLLTWCAFLVNGWVTK
jgi:hypothetical protein